MIAKHANDLIDEWIDDDEVEFISRFARPLPQRVMADILGFPLDDSRLVGPARSGTVRERAFSRTRTREQCRRTEAAQPSARCAGCGRLGVVNDDETIA